jgi:hypothetical protein
VGRPSIPVLPSLHDQQFSVDAMQLRGGPVLPGAFRERQRFRNRRQSLINLPASSEGLRQQTE